LQEVRGWIAAALSVEPSMAFGRLQAWSRDHGLPSLGEMGVAAQDMTGIAEASVASSSMKGNPVPLSVQELADIQRAAF
jgi:alcohol dehydrogenase class IV